MKSRVRIEHPKLSVSVLYYSIGRSLILINFSKYAYFYTLLQVQEFIALYLYTALYGPYWL